MFLFKKPTDEQIRNVLARQRTQPFSYAEVGQSRGDAPPSYVLDHNRALLGRGEAAFERAIEALRRWEMFNIGWVALCWPDAPIEVGTTVGVLARLPLCWSLNACRIVYLVDDAGPVRRWGFAYGTLPEHAERGEESFIVEWRRDDDTVWYDLRAFSRPQQIFTWIGYPAARILQQRFAWDSKRAMVRYAKELVGTGGNS
jgi:uncharacterized protein (UPF0548 family)